MKRHFTTGLVAAIFALSQPVMAESFKEFFPEDYGYLDAEGRALVDKLDLQQGKVTVGDGIAELDISDKFYFIDAAGARVVLEDLWDNPPDESILGMVFPRNGSAISGSWGASIRFDPIGYVSDADADSYNYDDLLAEMQADTLASNDWRKENGYEAITLVGWAEAPHYNMAERELYWAKHLRFEGSEGDTLNYDIRELGRKGVLVTSFIGGMEQLEEVKSAVPDIMALTTFTEGNRYIDFQPGVDTVAAVGIGGLIAGKVLAKTGFLIVLLAFAKKGFVLIMLPVMWLVNKFKGGGKGGGAV